MRSLLLSVALVTFAGTVLAEPVAKADPKAGEKLLKGAKCDACHASMFGGDGTSIYTRPDHKVKTPEQLHTQVRFCATQLNLSWFPEEEDSVAAYLNQRYYKLK